MKQWWEKVSLKVGTMSMRERALVFVTLLVLAGAVLNTLLLEPIAARQKMLRSQLAQKQELLAALQKQIALIVEAKSPDTNSPQRIRLNQIKQELAEGNAYLQSSRDKLVLPENMADHLRQLLQRDTHLQLVSLQTLPVTPLIEQAQETGTEQDSAAQTAAISAMQDKQVFKHGVQLTLRGNYLELLQYVKALENLPQQMFWARAELSVVKYPTAELTLTLYTLSLDKTWLKV